MKAKGGEKDEKLTTVFVGGLRKCTSEDKVAAHFGKYGQVDNVDIKRLPDGTSRGFAFVKFMEVETVDKVMENRSQHMIDNKWVAVRPHGGSAFTAAQNAEKETQAKVHAKEDRKAEEHDDPTAEDHEEKWTEKYLTVAAQVGAMQKDEPSDAVSTTQAMSMLGQAAANPMAMGGCMGGMGGMGMGMPAMGMMPMMNPMMMNPMMNPMMMGMMNPMMMMGMMSAAAAGSKAEDGGDAGGGGGPAPKEGAGSQRSTPY